MASFPGYIAKETIFENDMSLIVRGEDENSGLPVVLKIQNISQPKSKLRERFINEYQTGKLLAGVDGVITNYDLKEYGDCRAIVMEDIGGISLDKMFRGPVKNVTGFLTVAIKAARVLADIHKEHVIHKDIKPQNIIYNQKTGKLRIIDFSISTRLSRERIENVPIDLLEGTLGYIAPEQTGRMGRSIDYRADLYSLGATYYMLLTGRPMFKEDNESEIVHAHMCQQPIPVSQIHSVVPEALSRIVMKLLAKDASDRYQSAYGLRMDLEQCLDEIKKTGSIKPFPLAAKDIPSGFHLPEKMYGRQAMMENLRQYVDRICNGDRNLILFSGGSGMGKTRSIAEIEHLLVEKRGRLVSGKYEKLKRAIPYSGIIQAIGSLVTSILSEPEEILQKYKERIVNAVKKNGRLITDLIPRIEYIIGPQPEVESLGPSEARLRFNYLCQEFVKALAFKERPLAFFLDDLQWADSTSLEIIESIGRDQNIEYFLFIGAYRDDEVDSTHPLTQTKIEFERSGILWHEIALTPLNETDVNQMLSETFHRDLDETQHLATLVKEKTDGNPFHIGEFLRELYYDKLITFKQGWQWSIEKIEGARITENVVEQVAQKISRLPYDTIETIKIAACIGVRSDLDILAAVCKENRDVVMERLKPALTEELLVRLENGYRFSHDRICEAANRIIRGDLKKKIHRRIGDAMMDFIGGEKGLELFDVVNHLNLAAEMTMPANEKIELSQLNYLVGLKARDASAFGTAFEFFTKGINLLDTGAWEEHYELTLGLYVGAAGTAYISGDSRETERMAEEILSHTTNVLDEVEIHEILIQAALQNHTPHRAVSLSLDFLKKLGVSLPRSPSKLYLLVELIKTQLLLRKTLKGKQIEDLVDLPELTDPYQKAIAGIYVRFSPAVYFASPNLHPLLALKRIQLSLRYGKNQDSAGAFGVYAIVLCGHLGRIETGYRYGRLLYLFIQKYSSERLKVYLSFLFINFIKHWKDPLCESLPGIHEVFETAVASGELQFGSFSTITNSYSSPLSGMNLSEYLREIEGKIDVLHRLKQDLSSLGAQILMQAFRNLVELRNDPCQLIGAYFDEHAMLPIFEKKKNMLGIWAVYVSKLYLSYLFGEYENAVEYAKKADASKAGTGTYLSAIACLYQTLSLLAHSPSLSFWRRLLVRKKIRSNMGRMEKWAKHAPENFECKLSLMKAELARIENRKDNATQLYRRGIAQAQENGFLSEVALGFELWAKHALSNAEESIAVDCLVRAREEYRKWGAFAKVAQLETQYGGLFEK